MEKLLNSLIARGWKPFGDIDIAEFNQIGNTFVAINYDSKVIGQPKLRQIVSKESGLWQFVCENGMYNKLEISDNRTKNYDAYYNESDDTYSGDDYGYRLIESALKNEDELEEFLLDNIKINE